MSNVIIPKSATKARKTNTRNVLGIIPNNGIDLNKEVARINGSDSARVNYTVFVTGITAYSGGGQVSATQLDNRAVQVIENVDAPGDSVKLPQAVKGMMLTLVNKNANAVDVFSNGTDSLEGSTSNAVVLAGTGGYMQLLATSSTTWIVLANL